MYLKRITKQAVALVLILALALGLSACSAMDVMSGLADQMGLSTSVTAGERLSGSKWINSDIEGAIDENTQLDLKDDFHSAVNRDWFLENDAEGNQVLSSFTELSVQMLLNQLALMKPGAELSPDPKVMSEQTLQHLQKLVWNLAELAGDTEKRNELGAEPLRPYLEAIEEIDTLDEMTKFLINRDGMNLTGDNLFNFQLASPMNSRDAYTVHIFFPDHLLLCDTYHYADLGSLSYKAYMSSQIALEHVMGELGYSPEQINRLLRDCYTFEQKISGVMPHSTDPESANYSKRGDTIYTIDDIRALQGNFPLDLLLKEAGVAHSDSFRLYEPAVLSYMGDYYKEKNLEYMKAYFMVHSVLDALPYLDETCKELYQPIYDAKNPTENLEVYEEMPMPELSDEDWANYDILCDYVSPLINEVYELCYIGSYLSHDSKQEIRSILEDIRAYYLELIDSTDWLGSETRAMAIEKLNKMEFRVLYPDVLPDYSNLDYENYAKGGTLIDALAAIRQRDALPDASKVNQSVKRSDWDLNQMSTLVVNAYNEIDTNSIVILAGFLAGVFMYDEDAPVEQKYARLGFILGHEVSHAFDTSGYAFDAEGLEYGWWTNEDEVAFHQRADRLSAYYSGMSYLPGQIAGYDGALVQGEAISDMGGMKCMLALAENIPDFDYDLFFRSYAAIWRTQKSLLNEIARAADAHPLDFLRTNATLQQFDKFYETYDIGPGDGMYLAPENRVLVW